MLHLAASLIFAIAFSGAIFVIAAMVLNHKEKMLAALLCEPMPVIERDYHVETRNRRLRVRDTARPSIMPQPVALRA